MAAARRVFGIGTDVVYTPRVAALWQRYGDRFSKRFCSPSELEQLALKSNTTNATNFLASR